MSKHKTPVATTHAHRVVKTRLAYRSSHIVQPIDAAWYRALKKPSLGKRDVARAFSN